MKKILTKAVSLTVSAFLVFSVSACKKSSPEDSSNSTKDKPVNIKWLAYTCYGQPDPDSVICKEVEKKFNAKFDFVYVDGNSATTWNEQLNVKLAAGDLPDVMLLRDQNNLARYVQQGLLAELPQDTIKKKSPNYAKVVDKYDKKDIIWRSTMYNGKNYGFTNINITGVYAAPIVWRTDWLKNVGIAKIPSTIAEVEDALTKFRNNDPDQDGKKDTYGMSNSMNPVIFASYGITYGCQLTEKDGKIVYAATTPEAKQALIKLAEWYKNGLIDPESVIGEHTTGYWAISNAFENNKIGVTSLGAFYHYNPPLSDGDLGGTVYQDFKNNNPTMQYGFGKAIVGPTGKAGATMFSYATQPVGITVQGAKDERIVDTVLAMLDATYSNDKDFTILNAFGSKDTDYTVNGQGVYNSKITNAAEQNKKGIQVFTFASTNPDLVKEANPALYKWADENFTYSAIYPPFINPTKDYMDAVSQYQQNLQKLTTQAYNEMIIGKVDINSYFDSFVAQFNSNGGKAIEDAANAANKSK